MGWRERKHKEIVTASLRLMLAALVAPATATPDWSSLSERSWALTSDIHHFAAQVKMASILQEFSGEYFDFDRPSSSSL